MPAIAVIPARMASTRLPGKPLLSRTGKALIMHVLEQVRRARLLTDVLVATDDLRILEAVQSAGGRGVMTRPDHPNGSSRIAEVACGLDAVAPQRARECGIDPDALPIIINVQGDEPEVDPEDIDRLIHGMTEALRRKSDRVVFTLCAPITDPHQAANPNIVKVVVDQHGRAIYFSRAAIPFDRDDSGANRLRHLGLYAYRRDFLQRYIQLPPTPLERTEQLEQLRIIEHGLAIGVVQVEKAFDGIDTPEQYEAFVQRYSERSGR
ncbi:MAG: 3-deoxy-manno-octulosonate cytidylyltransferase [Phycisphaeraceae bacterium]|nr:3-deoxy-manno-octulosonate cytidylyltransferase [Phycisphaeraceae bacterium]